MYSTIFTDPSREISDSPNTSHWKNAYECLHYILSASPGSGPSDIIRSLLIQNPEDTYIAWLLSALIPWSEIPNPVTPNGKASVPWVAIVARYGLKATTNQI